MLLWCDPLPRDTARAQAIAIARATRKNGSTKNGSRNPFPEKRFQVPFLGVSGEECVF